jgi:hypothetical protein
MILRVANNEIKFRPEARHGTALEQGTGETRDTLSDPQTEDPGGGLEILYFTQNKPAHF